MDYLKRIFDVENFKKEFFETADKEFIQYFRKSLRKKLATLFEQYHKKIQKRGDELATNDMSNQLRTSKRYKFPWCINEVNEALNYFKNHIDSLTN